MEFVYKTMKLPKLKRPIKLFGIFLFTLFLISMIPLDMIEVYFREAEIKRDLTVQKGVGKVEFSEIVSKPVWPLIFHEVDIYEVIITMGDGGIIAIRNGGGNLPKSISVFGKYSLHNSCNEGTDHGEPVEFIDFDNEKIQQRLGVKIETVYDLINNYDQIQIELGKWRKNPDAQKGQVQCFYVREYKK